MKLLWRRLFGAKFFSPKGFLVRAAVLTAMFFLLHALSLREYTSIISGTSPTGDRMQAWPALLGVAYLVMYFLFILVAPILALGALILLPLQHLAVKNRSR